MKAIFAHLKTITILTIVGILGFGLLSNIQAVGDIFSFLQSLFLLFLVLFVLPLAIYQYNTARREKVMEKKGVSRK